MIVVARPPGRSFKWLATYITTDAKAQTSDRVLFTHTVNLPFDDVGSAVDTMLRTYLARNILKREAGIRPGGPSVEKPVKHIMLSWEPSERPTKGDMIEAAESYLRAVGYQDHQCLLAAHSDRRSLHVHLCLNVIHPETGKRLDDRFERRRAQRWGLAYEQARGKVYCTERLKPVAEREASPSRNVWQELRGLQPEPAIGQQQAAEIDYDLPPHLWRRQEWTVLKERQKEERLGFFTDLAGSYRTHRQQLYKTTSAQFRGEWARFFQMQRTGASAEALKAYKEGLLSRQKGQYQLAVREAAPHLKEAKEKAYRELLARQKAERALLVDRQEMGRTSHDLVAHPSATPVETPRFAPPSVRPPGPQHAPGRPFLWSMKAGMVAQQRSADRWLDRALDRVNREVRAPSQGAQAQSNLAKARERLAKEDKGQTKSGPAIGVGLDRSGGSGM